jgi:hypothetical protein
VTKGNISGSKLAYRVTETPELGESTVAGGDETVLKSPLGPTGRALNLLHVPPSHEIDIRVLTRVARVWSNSTRCPAIWIEVLWKFKRGCQYLHYSSNRASKVLQWSLVAIIFT